MNISQCNPLHLYVNPIQAASGLAAALRLWPLFCPILNFDSFYFFYAVSCKYKLKIIHVTSGTQFWFTKGRYQSWNWKNQDGNNEQTTSHKSNFGRFWLLHLWSIPRSAPISWCSHHHRYDRIVTPLGPVPGLLTLDLPSIIPMGVNKQSMTQ